MNKSAIEKIIEIEQEALKKLEPIYQKGSDKALRYFLKLAYTNLLSSRNYLETVYEKLK